MLFTHPWVSVRFLVLRKETTNFTYPIWNQAELSSFVSGALGREEDDFNRYVAEIDGDSQLWKTLEERAVKDGGRNRRAPVGRMAGRYCLVRALKPRGVVETGSHDGMGTSAFARGLQRNAAEGRKGIASTLDLDEGAGRRVPEHLRPFVRFIRGDAKKTLPAIQVNPPVTSQREGFDCSGLAPSRHRGRRPRLPGGTQSMWAVTWDQAGRSPRGNRLYRVHLRHCPARCRCRPRGSEPE